MLSPDPKGVELKVSVGQTPVGIGMEEDMSWWTDRWETVLTAEALPVQIPLEVH